MNDYSNEELFAPQLSRIRTFLFWALAFDWFIEMVFLGFPSLSKVWAHLWHVVIPENPQLATALSITQALEAPAKGAFFVMAVFGLRSRNPSTRAALFVSMALVPPLNMAFPLRQQGFLLGPAAVGTTLSAILWGSFFLFRERSQQPEQRRIRGSGQLPLSRWETFRYVWFAAYSAALTLLAFLFLFWPRTSLNLVFPCLSSLLNTENEGLSSLIYASLPVGTQLLAVATGCWIATVNCRSNPTLRQAFTVASTVHAGLFFVFPLPQMVLGFGGTCASSSILIAFVPLFVCWVLYVIVDTARTRLSARQPVAVAPAHLVFGGKAMMTTALEMKVRDFLVQERIAIAGVSRDNGCHPAANLTSNTRACGGSSDSRANHPSQISKGECND